MSNRNDSATDLLAKLKGLDISSLEPLQRVLLVTDGTLTEILEAAFLERIQLVKILQQVVSSHEHLEWESNEPLIAREVLLRGERSQRNYVYAKSLIAIDRLQPTFRQDLLESNIPLGRLWLEHKLETYKEIVGVRFQSVGKLSCYFESDAAVLLIRSYRVFSAHQLIMIITEHFPAGFPCMLRLQNNVGAAEVPSTHTISPMANSSDVDGIMEGT